VTGDHGAPACQLATSIQIRLPDAVADARDQEYSWAEIGDLLGLTGLRLGIATAVPDVRESLALSRTEP